MSAKSNCFLIHFHSLSEAALLNIHGAKVLCSVRPHLIRGRPFPQPAGGVPSQLVAEPGATKHLLGSTKQMQLPAPAWLDTVPLQLTCCRAATSSWNCRRMFVVGHITRAWRNPGGFLSERSLSYCVSARRQCARRGNGQSSAGQNICRIV
jgi:hypothetical protein